MIFYILTAIFLGICAVTDLLWQQIWCPPSLIFMVLAVSLHFIRGDKNIWNLLAGILLGVGLLFVSWATREAIGYGDGLIVAACGSALGFITVFQLLLLALMFSAIWSGILLIFGKVGKKACFPFVPFLLAAQLCIFLV